MDTPTPTPQQLPSGYTWDAINNQMKPSYDEVSQDIKLALANKRLTICRGCEMYTDRGACGFCGCGMSFKATLIYPLDQDGKAFYHVDPYGKYIYVCQAKKW